MADPYTPPESVGNPVTSSEMHLLLKIGIGLYLAPLLGFMITIWAIFSSFSTLGEASATSPERLAGEISMALISAIVGSGLGFLGALMMFIALMKGALGNRMVFWIVVSLSAVYCFMVFPFGLIGGGGMIVLLMFRKAQFFSIQKPENRF